MLEKFSAKKTQILDRLSKPAEAYLDASPKGSVDEDIRMLIEEINGTPGFVTTSSCAGRIAVFLEGASGNQTIAEPQVGGAKETFAQADAIVRSTGGKGGGRWLFTSHAPVDVSTLSHAGTLFKRLGFSPNPQISYPSPEARPQFVHFKFEPMILHILTASAEHAQEALNAAMAAGFRESGVGSIVDSKNRPTAPMVAVRSSGLALDSIIGFQDQLSSVPGAQIIRPMVSEAYLRTLIQVANERFEINNERRARFREALLEQTVGMKSSAMHESLARRTSFEPAAARRERKRREGLLRREEMLAFTGALDGSNEAKDTDDTQDEDDFGVGLLMQNDEAAGLACPQADGINENDHPS